MSSTGTPLKRSHPTCYGFWNGIDSTDAMCERINEGVSLLCRAVFSEPLPINLKSTLDCHIAIGCILFQQGERFMKSEGNLMTNRMLITIGTTSKNEIVWNVIKTSFFLPLMLVSWPIFAQVYRCEINSQPIYQPGPCQDHQTTNMRKLDVPSFKSTTAPEDLSTPFETIKYHNAETIKIEEDCQNKYPNDARMIRYCVNKEREAQGDVDRLKGAPTEILNYCYEKWNEWSMREHCINSNSSDSFSTS